MQLLFLTDVLLYWLALNIATLTRIDSLASDYMWALQRDRLVCVTIFALASALTGSYRTGRFTDRFDAVYFSLAAVVASLLVELLLTTLLPVEWRAITRREIILGAILGGGLLSLWRFNAAGFAVRFRAFHRFFYVLGNEEEGRRIAEAIRTSPDARADALYVSLVTLRAKVERAGRKAGAPDPAQADAIVAMVGERREDLVPALAFCETHCRRTFVYPSLDDTLWFQHPGMRAVAGIPLVEVTNSPVSVSYHSLKRTLDVCLAAAAMLVVIAMCLWRWLVRRTPGRGPLFVREECVGRGGRPFRRIVFASGTRYRGLPQLFNVLKGDMSLVGPRPESPETHEQCVRDLPLYPRRLAVRPGMVGLGHNRSEYASDPALRLDDDLVYISSLSFTADTRILLGAWRGATRPTAEPARGHRSLLHLGTLGRRILGLRGAR